MCPSTRRPRPFHGPPAAGQKTNSGQAGDDDQADGHINAEPIKPLCFLEAPELSSLDTKRTMAEKILAAIADAYRDIANTEETLLLMNHYPLENAGWAGRLQSDNRQIVEAVAALNR
jgi:hypothetical protein